MTGTSGGGTAEGGAAVGDGTAVGNAAVGGAALGGAAHDAAPRVQLLVDGGWVTVCEGVRLTPGRGVAVLLPDGRQAALFLDRAGRLHAVDNRDPFTGASVLSRGLLGSAAGIPFVASPLLKQRFALTDGRCLDDDGVSVTAYQARVSGPAPARGVSAAASAPA
ncbi:nitrite reductase small subunit NirD [Streptomyces sp. TS71-3]|uniref:nitrite reductase small subunit NirD n=1 Tax=Streptomyces sp. TS71-3 TaxID=2733862 RepID=UPI001BB379E5